MKNKWTGSDIGMMILGLLIVVFLASRVMGATIQKPIFFGGPLDSVRAVWFENWVLEDSLTVTSFTASGIGMDSIAMDDTKIYFVSYKYFFTGDTFGYTSSEIVIPTPYLSDVVWAEGTRELTAIDEDNTTLDLDGTTVGALTTKTGFSLTAAQWEEVWRNIDTTNVDTSEIGKWLVSAISTGGGPQACTVLVDDGTNPIVNAGFRVYNDDRSTQIAPAFTTDANGKGFPWLTTGIDYDVIAYATGYSSVLTNNWDPDTATLTTISLTAFSINAPPNAQTCNVYGHLRNAAGDTARYCLVTFTLNAVGRNLCDSTIIGGEQGEAGLTATVTTDANGDFQVPLVESHCWDSDGDGVSDTVWYQMHVKGIDKDYEFIVPDAATFQVIREKQ